MPPPDDLPNFASQRPFDLMEHRRPGARGGQRPLLLIAAMLAFCAGAGAQTIPAFPGAEGAGAYAKGGRGGDVYHVTNTNPSGAGSLAYGLTTGVPSAGRTIVFDVSGYAHISSELRVTASKITIAGQTAPGDGFGLKDGTFRVSGDDIVIRHLRFRDGNSADAIDLDSGSLNAIFDHCDAMFSNDENMSSFGSPPENLTWQWGLNAWGMESHSCGGLWDQNHATCHHSLWAHNHTRNPKARPSLLDWVNNVTFDWDIGFILGDSDTPANWNANVVGNYFIAGTTGKTKALEKGGRDRNGAWNFHVYLNNNRFDANRNGLVDGTDTGWGMVSGDVEHLIAAVVNAGVPVTTDDPLTGYKKIVSAAGPLRLDVDVAKPLRDEVAALLITELVAQTHHHISSVANLTSYGVSNGGFGTLNSTAAPVDTDKDGMPDFWETALSSSATVDDHNHVLSAAELTVSFFPAGTVSGYTWLEEYLHFLSIPHAVMAKSTTANPTAIDIDLQKFTSGFVKSPTFTLGNLSGGSATPSGTGNRFVHFVPTTTDAGVPGHAKFTFTVTDAEGSTWTQQFGILVSASGVPRDLRWQGDGTTNAWDSATNNWLVNGSATAFGTGDAVLLNELGSNTPSIALSGSISPGAVTVDSAKNFTFASGSIAGAAPLTKSGSGMLTLGNANSFGGGMTLNEGTIVIGNNGALGSGAVTLKGGTLSIGSYAPPNAIFVADDAKITGGNGGGTTGIGALSGAAVLTINAINTFDLNGDTSGFGGTITLTGNSLIRLDGSTGSTTGTFDLGSGTNSLAKRTNVATVWLGAFAGGSGTTLSGATGTGNTTATTYVIGDKGLSTTFAGTIANGGGTTGITKNGAGTLMLTGTSNSYTGATSVSAGTLQVEGALGATAVTVANGATLGVNGNIAGAVTAQSGSTVTGIGTLSGGATLQSGATIAPANGASARGALTASAGFTVTSSTLKFDLSDSPGGVSPTGPNDRISVTGGSVSIGGTNTFQINFADKVLGAGSYKLIDCAAGVPLGVVSGMVMNLVTTAPPGARQTFTLTRTASGTAGGYIRLNVNVNAADLTWTGANSTWDLNSAANWSGGATATFFNLDAVTFKETAANKIVNFSGSLQPRAITVTNASNYTFNGPGTFDGAGSLTVTGGSSVTLSLPQLWVSSTTIANDTAVTVTSTSGLTAGLRVAGTGIADGTTIATIVDLTHLTLSQVATAGGTNFLAYFAQNTWTGGTELNASTLVLANDGANSNGVGPGVITFKGGTLTMYSNLDTYTGAAFQMDVPSGQTGTLNADARCDLYGSLKGGGTFNVNIPWIRTTLFSDWSAFSGTLNVITDGFAEPGGTPDVTGDLRMGTDYSFPGFPLATVSLGNKVRAYYTGILNAGAGTTIEIGELAGTSSSVLMGGVTGGRNFTYRIGGKTQFGSEVIFAGSIAEQNSATTTSLVKTGAGTWTLSGTCNWNGGTTVEQGVLKITGSVTCGAAVNVAPLTGYTSALVFAGGTLRSDAVNLSSGTTLTGNGTIEGDLNVSTGATVTCGVGTLAVTGEVVNNGTMRLTGGATLNATGSFVNNGVLDLLTGAQRLPANLINNGVVIDSSSLSQAQASKNGTTFTVKLRTYAGHAYQLKRADSLTAPTWTNIGTEQAGDGTVRDFIDSGATGAQRFYRVVVTP